MFGQAPIMSPYVRPATAVQNQFGQPARYGLPPVQPFTQNFAPPPTAPESLYRREDEELDEYGRKRRRIDGHFDGGYGNQ
jgi:hypothetical protein